MNALSNSAASHYTASLQALIRASAKLVSAYERNWPYNPVAVMQPLQDIAEAMMDISGVAGEMREGDWREV